jgi:hypothetical protein
MLLPSAAVVLMAACSSGGDDAAAVERLACETLAAKDSYHYVSRTAISVEDISGGATTAPADLTPFSLAWSVEADVIEGGDKTHARITTNDSGGTAEKEVLQVGSDAWSTLGPDTDFVRIEDADRAIPYPPSQTCQNLVDDLALPSMTGTQEKVNGIPSIRYDVSELDPAAFADVPAIGSGADAVTVVDGYEGAIWVASDGYISKMELRGDGEYEGGRRAIEVEISYEYSDINSVDIEIETPQPLAPQ